MNQQPDCLCTGNLRLIFTEARPLYNRVFRTPEGEIAQLLGVVDAEDDLYYMFTGTGGIFMLSCVGNFESYGYELLPDTPVSPQ